MAAFDQTKRYYLHQTIDASGRLEFAFMANSLADAQTVAQGIATITAVKLQLTAPDGTTTTYTPGAQGGTVSAPTGVQPV